MKEYNSSEINIGVISNGNDNKYVAVINDRGMYYDIFNHAYYSKPNSSLGITRTKLNRVFSILKYHHNSLNGKITEDEIMEVINMLNRSNTVKQYDDNRKVVTGVGITKYSVDKLYIGVLEKNGIKRHLALYKESDILYIDVFKRVYYGGPSASLRLGKGTLSSVSEAKEHVRSNSGYITSDELEDLLAMLNKTMNNNIKDIVLANISYLYDFVDKSGFTKEETNKLKSELYNIFLSYQNEINNFKLDEEENSNSLSPIKIKYMEKLISFDERLKDYINYEDDFEYQVSSLDKKMNGGYNGK